MTELTLMTKYNFRVQSVMSQEEQTKLITTNFERVIRTVHRHTRFGRFLNSDEIASVVGITMVTSTRTFNPEKYCEIIDETELNRLYVAYIMNPVRSALFREVGGRWSGGLTRKKGATCGFLGEFESILTSREMQPDLSAIYREQAAELASADHPQPSLDWFMSDAGGEYLRREYVEKRRSVFAITRQASLKNYFQVVRKALMYHSIPIRGRKAANAKKGNGIVIRLPIPLSRRGPCPI